MDSTLYDQLLPHRGLFHPGTVACGGSGPTLTSSSTPSRRPTATNRPPILDIPSSANCGSKWRRISTTVGSDNISVNACHTDDSDVTLGLALTSPDIEDFLFHTPPPSEISSDDTSTALPLTPQPFQTCEDDDNVLVGLLGGGVSMATTPESDILFTGAVTAEQEAYARGFVDALEELRRKDEVLGKPVQLQVQQQHSQHNQISGCAKFCFEATSSVSERALMIGKSDDRRQSSPVALSTITRTMRWPTGYIEVSPQQSLCHQPSKEMMSPSGRTTSNGQSALLADTAHPSAADFTAQQQYRQAKVPRLSSVLPGTSASAASMAPTTAFFRSSNNDCQRQTLGFEAHLSLPPSVSGKRTMFVSACRTSLSPAVVSQYLGQPPAGSTAPVAGTDERAQTVPRLGTTPPLASLSTGSVVGLERVAHRHMVDFDVGEDDIDDEDFGGNMTPRELARADRKRERNRLAARKCRSRKLEQIATLEARCAVLRAENDALAKSASGLADDVAQLRDRLQRHVSGPDCRLGPNHKWPTISMPETRQSDVVVDRSSSPSPPSSSLL